jgi:hypothetical protein
MNSLVIKKHLLTACEIPLPHFLKIHIAFKLCSQSFNLIQSANILKIL